MMPRVVARSAPQSAVDSLLHQNIHPLLARLYAARGIDSSAALHYVLARMAAPQSMLNLDRMAQLLADAVAARQKLVIIADYDADGATACAVGLRSLRLFGAQVDYLVPDRFKFGYGLTPEIVRLAAATKEPDVLITVDNGIASIEGVAEANRLGIKVLITDHHLPGERLPEAWCIINPNQPHCRFPSKHLAGVGVMFYLMLALRAELRVRGAFASANEPNLADLLPLVALGTIADVVKLDENNRILVHQGLLRVRAGRLSPGLAALFRIAGREPAHATVYDLGFVIGPRLNAAGRLTDMSLGIECLATDDPARALRAAAELDALNRERRALESGMQEDAFAAIDEARIGETCTVSLFDPGWHLGVVGVVASRVRERWHRPTIAFARASDGEIRGSGRSIPGLHLRDLIDLVAKRHPQLILRFGGHAAAAGLAIRERDFVCFSEVFEQTARMLLTAADLERCIETDGSLELEHATLESALLIRDQVWGQGFPEPRFFDRFDVRSQRIVADRHLKLRLERDGRAFDAMLFGSTPALPARIAAAYRLTANEYNGTYAVQLAVEHWQASEA